MITSPPPQNEARRLAALHGLDVLDTPPEPFFDAIAQAAAATCAAPIALVSLVDEARQWFKAKVGLDACETGRDVAFCAHALHADTLLRVPDARRDPRFHDNPLVTGEPGVVAYHGAPLLSVDGLCLGTLCVIHHTPTTLTPAQEETLIALARGVSHHLEVRLAAKRTRAQQVVLGRFVADAPVAIAMFDRSMRYVAASRRWSMEFGGGDPAKLVGEALYDTAREAAAYREAHALALSGTTVRNDDDRYPDGRRLRWEVQPWRLETGEIGGVLIVAENVTAQRRAAEALAEQAARFELALRFARAAAWEYELSAGRFFASEDFGRLFGRRLPADARLRDLVGLVHRDDRKAILAAWRDHAAGGPAIDLDHRVPRPGSEPMWVRSFAQAQHSAEGVPVRLIGFTVDISTKKAEELELARARDAAEAANRAQTQFLANISHEIRTPLNGVLGLAGALSRSDLAPEQRELVALIERSGGMLESIVGDLLDISKIEAGGFTLADEAFDPAAEIEAVASLMGVRAQQKGLAFEAQIDPGVRGVYRGDGLRFKQVIGNLLSNAIKFTERGEVALRAFMAEGGDRLTVAVCDAGIGFDEAHAALLFDRFSQADASITRRFGGTGLGLAICKALVELMQGEIWGRTRPTGGSEFGFSIPLRPAPAVDAHAAGAPAERTPDVERSAAALSGLRVLAVEDHPINRRVLEVALRPFGVDLTLACDGREGVELYAAREFGLVLMDMQMPGLDGLSATREIRRLEGALGRPRTPVAILSANALPWHRDEAFAAGADEHIAKPITPASLVEGMLRTLAASLRRGAPAAAAPRAPPAQGLG